MRKTFTEIIDSAITEKTKSDRQREPHIYWPSEASIVIPAGVIGKCHRASYYNYTGVPPTDPIPASSLRKMEAGHSIEENEHKFATQAGILVGHNIKKRKEYDGVTISAEIDALYKNGENTSIVEIKSLSGYFSVSSVFGGKIKVGYPKLDHLLQTTLYLDMFDYPETVIRYIDRETCSVKEHVITLTPIKVGGETSHVTTINGTPNLDFTLERIIDRYKVLDTLIATNTLPKRDFSPSYTAEQKREKKSTKVVKKKSAKTDPVRDWQCSYCRWLDKCTADGP